MTELLIVVKNGSQQNTAEWNRRTAQDTQGVGCSEVIKLHMVFKILEKDIRNGPIPFIMISMIII